MEIDGKLYKIVKRFKHGTLIRRAFEKMMEYDYSERPMLLLEFESRGWIGRLVRFDCSQDRISLSKSKKVPRNFCGWTCLEGVTQLNILVLQQDLIKIVSEQHRRSPEFFYKEEK